MKNNEFTPDEMEFLLKNVERGLIISEKETIEIESIGITRLSRHINGNYYDYLVKSKDRKDKKEEFKNIFLEKINKADDFEFVFYDDYCNLVTYDLIPESDELYMQRLKSEGRQIITNEKVRLKKRLKSEARKVLFEKTMPKKYRNSRIASILCNHFTFL